MNISEYSAVFGMIVTGMVGLGTGTDFYLQAKYIAKADPAPYDQIYVLVAKQNLKLLYEAEDELERLKLRAVCDTQCIARKATLKERIRNLQE